MREIVNVGSLFLLLWAGASVTPGCGQFNRGIRLVDGSGLTDVSAGRLEVYVNFRWNTVCITSFNVHVADLVCKELHYHYASAFGNTSELGHPLNTLSLVAVINISCPSLVPTLSSCYVSSTTCSHTLDVSVICTNERSPVRLVSESGRTEDLSAGRLEIFINNRWGTVCDDSFSLLDANVACHQMGFEKANSYSNASFIGYTLAPSSTPTWLDDLYCSTSTVDNDNLRLCSHNGVGQEDCGHKEDIILSCTSHGFLRLVYSSNSSTTLRSYGRLEIYLNGAWGTVCDVPRFTFITALVACRQLGFNDVNCHGTASELGYSTSSPTPNILLNGVSCSQPSLNTLLSCSYNILGPVISSIFNNSHAVGLSCSTQSLFGSITSRSSCPSIGGGTGDNGSGGSSVSSIVGAVAAVGLTSSSMFITILFVCISLTGSARHIRRRHARIRTAVPPMLVASVTESDNTTTGGTILYSTQHHEDAYSPEHENPQKPTSSRDRSSPTVPGESTLEEAPPPPYEYAIAYPPAYPGKARSSKASNLKPGGVSIPYPMQSLSVQPTQVQGSMAPYPTEGEKSITPNPTQGEGSMDSPPTVGDGSKTPYQTCIQLSIISYPAQGQGNRALNTTQEEESVALGPSQVTPYQTNKNIDNITDSTAQVEGSMTSHTTQIKIATPYPAQGERNVALYPAQVEGNADPYETQREGSMATCSTQGDRNACLYSAQGERSVVLYPNQREGIVAPCPNLGEESVAPYPNHGEGSATQGALLG